MVPFIDLTRLENGFIEEFQSKVIFLTKKAQFIGGDEVANLELRLKEILSVDHVVTCANGTDALQLALRALGVGINDRVLVPNVTFWATFESVVNVGAIPVTIDADLRDGGVLISSFKEAVECVKPKAAIVAHLYGWGSAKLEEIRRFCRERNVMLLEDGAQSFGVEYNGYSIYKDALISTVSFYPAKVLGGAGDGGAVFTNDEELSNRVRQLANHGRTSHYAYGQVGWNSRLDSIQAAYLNLSLDHISHRIASRRNSADYYRRTLRELEIEVLSAPESYRENGYCNVCIITDLKKKKTIESALKSNQIGFGNIYPSVMSSQPGAKGFLDSHFGGSQGENLCATVLNLPLFPYMEESELEYVVSIIRKEITK